MPRLRPLDLAPFEAEGRTLFRIQDFEGVSEGVFVLTPEAMFVASLLDGASEMEDVQAAFAKAAGGAILPKTDIEALIQQLDEKFLLFTQAYENRKREIRDAYLAAPVRKSALAGTAYPGDRKALGEMLDAYFTAEGGPGVIGEARKKPMRAAVAPHIDFPRGNVCYAHIFKEIAERSTADVFIIIGVAHATPPYPFAVSTRGFETPLGVAPVDIETLERLRKLAPKQAFEMEPSHRTEHSAEFQVVWLQHVVKRPFTILPILVGSFDSLDAKTPPDKIDGVESFVGALREAIAPLGQRAFVLSGADLAHVGPRFGDSEKITKKFLQWMEEGDMASLGHAVKGDAAAWYASTVADGNKRKVCGLGSVYTLLRVLGPASGTLVRYGYAPDPLGGVVSFAGVAFE